MELEFPARFESSVCAAAAQKGSKGSRLCVAGKYNTCSVECSDHRDVELGLGLGQDDQHVGDHGHVAEAVGGAAAARQHDRRL